MNALSWRLQWPERADNVEQQRPWRVKCVYTPWKLAGKEIEVEGPERYAESHTRPAVSEACSQSIIPRHPHDRSTFNFTPQDNHGRECRGPDYQLG